VPTVVVRRIREGEQRETRKTSRTPRCLTLEDTVEYFNLIQQLHLTAPEKKDLVAFLRCL